ncbi:dehydrogenase/reductase SDR family member 7-like [Scleropages formosus]|uniref:Dehydrogenase/reductase (SDR family) member 7 n=1 Tax=Scleropages formosus TaxID=113540 RepID=A0A0P7V1A9_SCLFO|nr:dehydrogenase/reductase SDR family member 7 [Scleropages formosus]XP_018583091.2 dehydrogenase/reductase SDR family member 7 [Scleropages formosus]KPP76424.1 dehydrogenase/reductase SDR family member 7-like [Scleropages formosus]
MDLVTLLLCASPALYLLVQLLRFICADADLTLLWAAAFGRKPEKVLRGQVVWITGASSGIGEELAYQLASLGARLILSARRQNELERVKRGCLERSSLQEKDILVLPLDLLQRGSHEAKTRTVVQYFGKIDILINNGGRTQRSLFLDTGMEVYQALMDLNYLGTVSLTKHVLPHMTERGTGAVVTVSSAVGLAGAPLATGYSASKHALQGFFNSLRAELAHYPRITISTVCPGPVQSQIVQNAFLEQLDQRVTHAGDQQYKMSTSRCVRLILVGIANDIMEMWISEQPFLLFFYLWQYTPTWAWTITNILGKRRVRNFKAGLDADSAYFTKAKTS